MSELLIFGGTSEGRLLAQYCAGNGIPADVCVVSQTGADFMEERTGLMIHVGALDRAQMCDVMLHGRFPGADAPALQGAFRLVIDATHPYAREASANIRFACETAKTPYLRVKRESEPIAGEAFDDLSAMVSFLNERISSSGGDIRILSALGGKSLGTLTAITDFKHRVYARVLPSDAILMQAKALGYPADHIIMEKGPFSVSRNLVHLKMCGASYFLTKESGKAGGYPEKVQAAECAGAVLLTLRRVQEEGVTLQEACERIKEECG